MNFLYCLLGIITWIALNFASSKNIYDKEKKIFKVREYVASNYDDWIFAFFGGFVVLVSFPFMWSEYFLVNKLPVPELNGVYAPLCGFIGGVLLHKVYVLAKKLGK